jgi:hypothetical protein
MIYKHIESLDEFVRMNSLIQYVGGNDEMTFHCRCNIKESECSYPECVSGQRDMTIEKIDKIASELQDTCHKQAQRIAALEAELDDVKQVQFPRKVEAVTAGLATKLAAVEKEREELRNRVAVQDELLRILGEAVDWMHGSNRYLTREAVQALTKYRVWAK